ncbi:uncharacterized protein LOC103704770 isoform X2 [Phoenix dactylifera]|uniref:Uncharacterized protein LOC103704770 isoform X2 n=1 Tax=Phoenix dactylifera TaxID=42345 RepID=A0A8B8J3E6_PHODC|nr:uncharacterized protein LOC103704770 isoform X2 [Phoenix dactylifera]
MLSCCTSLQFPFPPPLSPPSPRVSSIPFRDLGTLNPLKTRVSFSGDGRRRRSFSSSQASVPSLLRPYWRVPFLRALRGLETPDGITRVRASPAAAESQVTASPPLQISAAADAVRAYYDAFNRHDLASLELLISEDCVYEDLVFAKPFVGRKAILEFFKKFTESISSDLRFVIDDISSEDTSAVGVTWHLEWQSRPFPFSKGCSFYRTEVLDGKRQIVYGRDCVEPATKPGEMTLVHG